MLRHNPVSFEPYRTYAEYLRHWAFRASREAALRRDGYRCTVCGEPATEVHHIAYCRWGLFDPPSHLRSICHACHCAEHQKLH